MGATAGQQPRIGFVGIGLMGRPMTLRLLGAGFRVTVWNRTRDKLADVLAAGATAAASPADLAARSEVVLMCVTDRAAAEAVVFGPDGIAYGAAAGARLVDFSSIDPASTRAMAERLRRERGASWIDAPVSGGVPGAEQGTLAIMCGGDEADIAAVRPVLAHLAQRTTRMGPTGAGQTAKLCNQVIVGTVLTVLAEAVSLAEKSGIDAARLPEALAGGFADSRPLQLFVPRMAARRFEPPLGSADTMLKDLDNACALGGQVGAELPMASAAADILRRFIAGRASSPEATSLITLYDPQVT